MLVHEVKSQEIFSLEYHHEVTVELNVQNVEDFFKLHRGYRHPKTVFDMI